MKKSLAMMGILPLFLMACSSFASAQISQSQSTFSLNQPIIDQANILLSSEKAQLTQKIEQLWYKDRLVQTGVIIIPTTNGQAIFDYCMDKAKQWKLGDDKNNGLVMCIAVQDKKMWHC